MEGKQPNSRSFVTDKNLIVLLFPRVSKRFTIMNHFKEVTRIFIPSCALDFETCLLVGWKNSDNVCCVTGYVDITNIEDINPVRDFILQSNSSLGIEVHVLGVLENRTKCRSGQDDIDVRLQPLLARQKNLFHLIKRDCELPLCTLNSVLQTNIIILTYVAEDVKNSSFLELERPETNLGQLYHGWIKSLEYFGEQRTQEQSLVQMFIRTKRSFTEKCTDWFQKTILQICLFLSTVIMLICDNGLFGPVSCRFIPQPATLGHLRKVAYEVQSVLKNSHPGPKIRQMRLSSLLCRRLVDIVLGLTVMHLLVAENNTKLITDTVMTWAQTVTSELQQLLNWMMGVPAGLKLNYELAHFLGQFFLYHIYLWTGYLEFLAPLWTQVVYYVAVSGCLGITTQISLIQDMFSVMTLHSYCFYVYAARLYSLQMSGLLSLWRLFRGKKYNPLFERIDSSSYDADQLFVGTLLFTILLFLLPTTGLFYVVFTGLRMMVLIVHGVMYKLVSVLDSLPLYVMYVRVTQPQRVTGDVRLHVLPNSSNGPLYHAIQLLPVSMNKIIEMIHRSQELSSTPFDGTARDNIHPDLSQPPSEKTAYSWGCLVHMLMHGHLIYPWIEPVKSG